MVEPPDSNGFSRVTLSAPDGARAVITPYGAHVTSWTTPDGRERLFLSRTTPFSPGSAIRGGVPVIFPQFAGRGPLRPHGFARVSRWQHIATEAAPGSSTAHFRLEDSDATRVVWSYGFRLDLRVTVGGARLELALQVANTGNQPFTFAAALHTYLQVGDIATASLDGLGGLPYTEHGADHIQPPGTLRIAGEIDRIYWDVPGPVTVAEPDQTLRVAQDGFSDVVVWNPGPERAAALADLEPDGYRRMVCIEAAAIGQRVALAPGGEWQSSQQIDVLA